MNHAQQCCTPSLGKTSHAHQQTTLSTYMYKSLIEWESNNRHSSEASISKGNTRLHDTPNQYLGVIPFSSKSHYILLSSVSALREHPMLPAQVDRHNCVYYTCAANLLASFMAHSMAVMLVLNGAYYSFIHLLRDRLSVVHSFPRGNLVLKRSFSPGLSPTKL